MWQAPVFLYLQHKETEKGRLCLKRDVLTEFVFFFVEWVICDRSWSLSSY